MGNQRNTIKDTAFFILMKFIQESIWNIECAALVIQIHYQF